MGIKTEQNLKSWDEIGKPLFERKEIYFPKKQLSLYLKSKNWGITGNHKATVLSINSNLEFHPDKNTEYIFKGFGEIIYKSENGKLKIYYSNFIPEIPKNFKSEIQVELIELKGNEWRVLNRKVNAGYKKFE